MMKKNTYFLLAGCIAIAFVAVFAWGIESHQNVLVSVAFILAVAAIYFARRFVTDLVEDERSARITELSVMRTLQVFWVAFFAVSLGAVMDLIEGPPKFPGPFPFPPMQPGGGPKPIHFMGYVQLGLLCMTIFLYVGFRIYYARKFGEWETDAEQG